MFISKGVLRDRPGTMSCKLCMVCVLVHALPLTVGVLWMACCIADRKY